MENDRVGFTVISGLFKLFCRPKCPPRQTLYFVRVYFRQSNSVFDYDIDLTLNKGKEIVPDWGNLLFTLNDSHFIFLL